MFGSAARPDQEGGVGEPLALTRRGRRRSPVPVVLHRAAFRERCWAWADLRGGRYRLDPERLTRPTATTVLSEGPGVVLSGRVLLLTMIPLRTPDEGRKPGGQVLYRTRRAWRVHDTPEDGAVVA